MHADHLRRALADARAADLDRALRAGPGRDAPVALRAVRPGDRDALGAFFAGLSPRSRHRRFLSPRPALSDRELAAYAGVDHRASEGLLALLAPGAPVLGFAQYAAWGARPRVADFAVAVDDAWQGRGLGLRLGRALVEHARESGLRTLTATTLAENRPARALLARLGFDVQGRWGAELELALAL
jgi:acetyltransferase